MKEVLQNSDAIPPRFIETLLSKIPSVRAVYLFGSWATPDARPDSDIDLAVLPANPVDAAALWKLAQELAVMAGRDVDLVDLLASSTVMRAQVIAHGRRIFCSDESECARFEDYVFASYARLNEERHDILADIKAHGTVYG